MARRSALQNHTRQSRPFLLASATRTCHSGTEASNLFDQPPRFFCLQEADPDFNSKYIENPALDAHHTDPSLLPHGASRERKYITAYDPATGLHLKTYMADSPRDIETKIGNAAAAQEEWAYSTFADRKRVMKSLKRWLVENQDVCARVAARDSGKTCKLVFLVAFDAHALIPSSLVLDAALGEILTTAAKLDWLLDHGTRVLRPETRYSSLLTIYKHAEVHFEPLGVVAALVSWNYRALYACRCPLNPA